MKLRGVIAPIAGGATWLFVVMLRLRSVDESWWIARDDGVITLSHARNAARFGSIGVSPGDRVEGFSSPLHFLSAYVVQLVSNPGYRALSIGILVLASAITGAAVTLCLRGVTNRGSQSNLVRDVVAVGMTALVAAYVVASWTSVGWIGSGMENPVVICAGVAVAMAVSISVGPRLAQSMLILSLVLFMNSRVEFAAFAGPLVVAAAWVNATRFPAGRQALVLLQTIGATLGVVAGFHLLRRLYFGEWLPNTAVVQGRETGAQQLLFIALISACLLALLVGSVVGSGAFSVGRRPQVVVGLRVVAAAFGVGCVVMAKSGRTAGSVRELLSLQPIVVLVILVGALVVIQMALGAGSWSMNYVFASLSAVPLSQFVAVGPARLDDYRVAVIAVPFLALWAASLSVHLVVLVRAQEPPTRSLSRPLRIGLAALVAVGALAGLAVSATDQPRELYYEVAGANEILSVVHEVQARDLDGALAILANPDLGKVSFDKSAVMIDLGLLGDPLLTQIAQGRPDLVSSYLQLVGRPDVLESHGYWSCEISAWLDSPEFAESYALSDNSWLDGRIRYEECPLAGRRAIWLRSDAAAEYGLTRALMESSDPAAVVRDALDKCGSAGGGPFRCQPVRRSLQRASAALREDGTYGAAVGAMGSSPSADLDLPMLRRGHAWFNDAYVAFAALADGA